MDNKDTPQPQSAQDFDRILGVFDGLPDTRATRPAVVQAVTPFVGRVVQFSVQTIVHPDQGWTILLTRGSAEGFDRLVLPDKVAQAIYRQRARLVDRSTPDSRRRKAASRQRAKAKAAKAAKRRA